MPESSTPTKLTARLVIVLNSVRADTPELGLIPLRYAAIARVFFCTLVGKRIVMLHSFIKKSNRTPTGEREVAETRMKEIKRAIP